MNALTIGAIGAEPKTMSSREVAELTGKEISNIHRDIRTMLEQLGDDPELNHVREDKDGRGYTSCFHLPKSLSMTLVAGYSAKLRKAIIDRWQALEQQAVNQAIALPDFTNPADAAIAWAEQYRAKQALQVANDAQAAQLALAAPKAEALDRIATSSDGSVSLRVAAKLLQMPEREFLRELHARNWIFRSHLSHTWQGYSERLKAGSLEMKVHRIVRDDGTERTTEQTLVTRKGLARLAVLLQRPFDSIAA